MSDSLFRDWNILTAFVLLFVKFEPRTEIDYYTASSLFLNNYSSCCTRYQVFIHSLESFGVIVVFQTRKFGIGAR